MSHKEIPENIQMQFFVSEMVRTLSGDYRKSLNAMHEAVLKEHSARTGDTFYIYGTNVFFEDQEVQNVGMIRFTRRPRVLDPELIDQHVTWWEEFSEYQRTLEKILQTTRSITMRAESWQDIRDMFPEYIIGDFLNNNWDLSQLQRTRPDLFVGRPDHPDFPQNLAARSCWPINLMNMYSQVGGMLAVYVGYKYL